MSGQPLLNPDAMESLLAGIAHLPLPEDDGEASSSPSDLFRVELCFTVGDVRLARQIIHAIGRGECLPGVNP